MQEIKEIPEDLPSPWPLNMEGLYPNSYQFLKNITVREELVESRSSIIIAGTFQVHSSNLECFPSSSSWPQEYSCCQDDK